MTEHEDSSPEFKMLQERYDVLKELSSQGKSTVVNERYFRLSIVPNVVTFLRPQAVMTNV